ncbi:MAG: type II secretion system F family protein [Actinomycetota bacterium]|nr:type II secretion system F family protein [Actinomycetota bacterium]
MNGSLILVIGVASIGLAILVLVAGLLWGRARPDGVSGGLAAIERSYGLVQQSRGRSRHGGSGGRLELPAWSRALALRLSSSSVLPSLQRRLDVAGNPGAWTVDRMLAAKGLCMLVGLLLGGLFGLHSPVLAIGYALIGGAGLFFLPDLLLYNHGIKRQARVLADLPDAIDLLTVCAEAGLGFDAALAQVARNTAGPLAEEFSRSLQEMQIGRSRADALRGMVARTSAPDLRIFVSAVVQAGELGIPVARVLREQAAEMRVKRRQRAEEQAQKVPVKIMFPLIVCIFPALLVAIIGPGIIQIAHSLFGYAG